MSTYRAFILTAVVGIVLVEANVIPKAESTTYGAPKKNETSDDSSDGPSTVLPKKNERTVDALCNGAKCADAQPATSNPEAITGEYNGPTKVFLSELEGRQEQHYEPELAGGVQYRYSDVQHDPEEFRIDYGPQLSLDESDQTAAPVTDDDRFGVLLEDVEAAMQTTPNTAPDSFYDGSLCYSAQMSPQESTLVGFVKTYLWEGPLNLIQCTFFNVLRLLVSSIPIVNNLVPLVDVLQAVNFAYIIARLPEVVLSLGTSLPQIVREYFRDVVLAHPKVPIPRLLLTAIRSRM